jgi:hypothetical protein
MEKLQGTSKLPSANLRTGRALTKAHEKGLFSASCKALFFSILENLYPPLALGVGKVKLTFGQFLPLHRYEHPGRLVC